MEEENSDLDDGHDPEGLEVALQIAHNTQTILPPPKKFRKRRRRQFDNNVQFSGSGPDDRDPQLIGQALADVIKERGWGTQMGVRALLVRWSDLVGTTNADHCHPESFDGSTLTIRCDSTAWAHSLRMISPNLLAELNRKLGDGTVTEVNILGPTPPSWKRGRRSVPGRGPRDTYG